jgi:hypothetical protein
MTYFASITDGEFGNASVFPSDGDLKTNGINFQKVVQKPGDAVYVGYFSIHWVLAPVSSGFIVCLFLKSGGLNIAWNVVWPAPISLPLLNNSSFIPSEMLAYCILSCYDKYMNVTSLSSSDIDIFI